MDKGLQVFILTPTINLISKDILNTDRKSNIDNLQNININKLQNIKSRLTLNKLLKKKSKKITKSYDPLKLFLRSFQRTKVLLNRHFAIYTLATVLLMSTNIVRKLL